MSRAKIKKYRDKQPFCLFERVYLKSFDALVKKYHRSYDPNSGLLFLNGGSFHRSDIDGLKHEKLYIVECIFDEDDEGLVYEISTLHSDGFRPVNFNDYWPHKLFKKRREPRGKQLIKGAKKLRARLQKSREFDALDAKDL